MINIYASLLKTDAKTTAQIIEKLFPNNNNYFIEKGEVFISDGGDFECSVELGILDEIMLNANSKLSKSEVLSILDNMILELNKMNILYSIDYEIEQDGEFEEFSLKHPLFSSTNP